MTFLSHGLGIDLYSGYAKAALQIIKPIEYLNYNFKQFIATVCRHLKNCSQMTDLLIMSLEVFTSGMFQVYKKSSSLLMKQTFLVK